MEDVLSEGKDLSNFLWEMIKHTKDILMYKVSKRKEVYSEEEIKQIAEISEKVSKEELINIIYKLSELENKMKLSTQKTIIFETEIIKLCMKNDILRLEDRIEKLENEINTGKTETQKKSNVQKERIQETKYEAPAKMEYAASKVENKEVVSEITKQNNDKGIKEEKPKETKTVKISSETALQNWQNVLDNLKKKGKVVLYANLVGTEAVQINDMTVGIKFYNGLNAFREKLLKQSENMNILTKEIAITCGKEMNIKFEDASGEKKVNAKVQKVPEPKVEEHKLQETEEDVLEGLDIPINVIEE